MNTTRLFLTGIGARGRLGANPGEQDVPQDVVVDLDVEVQIAADSLAAREDIGSASAKRSATVTGMNGSSSPHSRSVGIWRARSRRLGVGQPLSVDGVGEPHECGGAAVADDRPALFVQIRLRESRAVPHAEVNPVLITARTNDALGASGALRCNSPKASLGQASKAIESSRIIVSTPPFNTRS